MKTEAEAKLVTIYVNSTDRWQGEAMYTAIVKVCQELGIGGATLVRCQEGYGLHRHLHSTRLLALSEDLPVRLEIVDSAAKVEALLAKLDEMIIEGMVTVQDVHVRRYRSG